MINVPLSYNEIDADALARILKSFAGRHHEEIVKEFERQLSVKTGAPHVLAVQSGTAAMHLALQVAGVKSGDVVIAPTFAYVATISPATYLGARLVLVDSEPETWNMDPSLTDEAIKGELSKGNRVAAIVVVHNYGMPARMEELVTLSKEFNVPLIEDAAESFGSQYKGRWTGTLGDLGVFSFNSNKSVTAFGGGALVSSRKEWIDHARYLSAHARSDVPYYLHEVVGYNYRMSPLTAAYGLVQLENSVSALERRRNLYHSYHQLGESVGLNFQRNSPNVDFQPWLAACLLPDGMDPALVLERLGQEGMEGRRLWKPMHTQPAFKKSTIVGGQASELLFARGLCLPAGSSGGYPPQVSRVIDLILNS